MADPIVNIERNLVGALQINPPAVMKLCEERNVTENWFISPEVKRVWPLLVKEWQEHGLVEQVFTAHELQEPKVRGWLTRCMNEAGTAAIAPYCLEQIAKAKLQRHTIDIAHNLRTDALELGGQEALNRAEAAIAEMRGVEREVYGNQQSAADFVTELLEEYETVYQKRIVEGNLKYYNGLRLPWEVLNSIYGGVKPGIHVIAARPSQGKTAMGVCMSAGIGFDGIKQLFFSVDMPRKQLIARYGSLFGQVSLTKLNRTPSREDIENFRQGLERFQRLNSVIPSDASRVDRIIGEIYRAVKYDGVKCVWIDYLQVIASDRNYHSHKDEIDSVLAQLKQCALNLNIPIFCLTQFNRDIAKEPTRQPRLTDLGDSGAIEREASTVLALWQDPGVRALWNEVPPVHLAMGKPSLANKVEPMWVIILKNQQGPTGQRPFVFYGSYFMFRPADHEAKPIVERDENGRIIRVDNSPFFNTIRDDFLDLTKADGTGPDDHLQRCGALGKRGL